jgi:hypothetical protein
VTDLARILAAALVADVREHPNGPPAEVSATLRTACGRSRPERIVSGRLHADTCTTSLRLAGGGAA